MIAVHIAKFSYLVPTGDDDHFAVKSALISVASRWKHIGSALGLHQDVLNTIQQTFGTDYSEAVSQIVSKWLAQSYNVEKFGRPSWDRLVEAVAHEAGGADRHKADEIARIHSTSGEMDKQEESLSPSGISVYVASLHGMMYYYHASMELAYLWVAV